MGMFDYLQCEVPLPDGFTGQMQTKDFDCMMSGYTITKAGHLVLRRHDWRRGEAERPVRIMFHGMLNFYGLGLDHSWHEYHAKFTDGALVGIEQVPPHDPTASG